MKTAFRCAIVSLSLVGLAACASMDRRSEQMAPARAMTAEELYIAHVERIARRRGIDVKWVNLPKFGRETALAQE